MAIFKSPHSSVAERGQKRGGVSRVHALGAHKFPTSLAPGIVVVRRVTLGAKGRLIFSTREGAEREGEKKFT